MRELPIPFLDPAAEFRDLLGLTLQRLPLRGGRGEVAPQRVELLCGRPEVSGRPLDLLVLGRERLVGQDQLALLLVEPALDRGQRLLLRGEGFVLRRQRTRRLGRLRRELLLQFARPLLRGREPIACLREHRLVLVDLRSELGDARDRLRRVRGGLLGLGVGFAGPSLRGRGPRLGFGQALLRVAGP